MCAIGKAGEDKMEGSERERNRGMIGLESQAGNGAERSVLEEGVSGEG